MKKGTFTAAAILTLFAGVASAQTSYPIWEQEVRREDLTTKRREAFTKSMELKPFAADSFNTLSSWTGGSALSSDAIKGKPVLLFTFSAWDPTSQRAFERAARLAEANADKGLIVVAIHGQNRWDQAVELAKQNKFKGLLAQDDGKLRAKLNVDQDPDFYVVDRAGQLRFADIETDSLRAAVERVLGETPEVAGEQPTKLKAYIAKVKKEADDPRPSTALPGPSKKLEVALPDANVYEKAAWPEKNRDSNLGANDVQNAKLPDADTFGTRQSWITPKPDWHGKVIILDFWATWCQPCKMSMPLTEDLARKYKDDLCVVAISGQGETQKVVEEWLRKKDVVYSHCYETKFNEQDQTFAEKLGIRGIPHVIIVSSDGIVRWQGNPLDARFRRLAELIIEIDPGVTARREAVKAAKAAQGG